MAPRSDSEPNDHDLRIWVSGELFLSIRHLAEREDRNLSQWCRRALRAAVNAELRKSSREIVGEAGEGRDG
jgi:hypothetical protein